jgi:hypothetical protein
MRHFIRLIVFILFVGPAVFFIGGVASAAPGNDEIGGAVTIPGLPFNDQVNTSDATVAADDPTTPCFGPSATVWYTFAPSQSMDVAIGTEGSDYDTTLAVFSGSPGALTFITCNDDAVAVFSKVAFTAEAGTQYFIMAGTCCGGAPGDVGPGGNLVLSAFEAPPPVTVTVAVKSTGTVTKGGTATVSGVVTCSSSANALILLHLTQQFARFRAEGDSGDVVSCAPTPTAWSLEVASSSGVVFGAGPAQANVSAEACDGLTCGQDEVATKIRLRRR